MSYVLVAYASKHGATAEIADAIAQELRHAGHTVACSRAEDVDSLWCFLLRELPGGRTRLIVSGYSAERPRALAELQNFIFWEPAHWIMQRRQFANLKRRAEAL
jgi:Flavodoxin domain